MENLKNIKDNDSWKRSLGYYFKAVDWKDVNKELWPPYKFLDLYGEELEITEEFIRWSVFSPQRPFEE